MISDRYAFISNSFFRFLFSGVYSEYRQQPTNFAQPKWVEIRFVAVADEIKINII